MAGVGSSRSQEKSTDPYESEVFRLFLGGVCKEGRRAGVVGLGWIVGHGLGSGTSVLLDALLFKACELRAVWASNG